MQIINQLLKSTPQDVISNYHSHLRLHLKFIMTTINKSKLQDLTSTQIRKNKCILQCYNKTLNILNPNTQNNHQSNNNQAHNQLPTNQSSSNSHEQLIIGIDELKDCKKSCKKQQHAVKSHLDDVNFYSKRKFGNCKSKCQKIFQNIVNQNKSKSSTTQINKNMCKPYNQCMWDCYNRLDRRYKDYWKGQQNDIIKDFL